MEKSKGQAVVERIEGWLSGYMAFRDPGVALVLAVWAAHTWVSERFDATPYLSITACTKGAGKSRLLALLSWISRGGKVLAEASPAYIFTTLENADGKVTLLFDEAEGMSRTALGLMRSLMLAGYLNGETIGRKLPNGETIDYRVYSPKAFACIGDVNPVLRDRAIVVTLERGRPARDLRRVDGMREAAELVEELRHGFGALPNAVEIEWCDGRDREIWSAMIGTAEALKLDKATMARLVRCGSDLVADKTAPVRRYESAEAEGDALELTYGERALKDLRRVLGEGERAIFSAVAVERMMGLPDGPWRRYKGVGLTVDSLAGLVSRFGVSPASSPVRMVAGKGARGARLARGYRAADVKRAVEGLGR